MSLPLQAGSSSDPIQEERSDADATLMVERVGRELGRLSSAVGELQHALGPAITAAAACDPHLMHHAQKLDLVAQSLQGLSVFLKAIGQKRIGQEPLDIEILAERLTLTSLGERLSGRDPHVPFGAIEMF